MPLYDDTASEYLRGVTSAAPARQELVFLVVDDEPLVARAFARALSAFGRVDQAHSVVEARLALTRGDGYAGIIVDVMLGDANGFEVVDIALRHCPSASVLVVTGSGDVAHGDEAMRRHVRILRKPFDLSELTWWVESATGAND